MSKKSNEKRISSIEPDFRDVLICKSKESRPYLEIFIQEPENISQQNLGTLFGLFEITDNSEDSSYVVNYIISVIKKEYFSQVKRGAVESFEAALHKANLALAKVAEHGNIAWIGHLHAVCAVIEKNNIHIAQSGNTSALLLRSKSLANLSEEGDQIESLNPLKTFQDVLSGRLENEDKIILTTEALFNIFSFEEVKRSAIKFSQEDFIQFLNTALINELERAAVLVIDIKEKEAEEKEHFSASKRQRINAFSQEAFAKKQEKDDYLNQQKERTELVTELKKELEKSQGGLIDEKTGHIYIKDDGYLPDESSPIGNYFGDLYEKISDSGKNLATSIKEKTKTKLSSISLPKSRGKKGAMENDVLAGYQETIPEKYESPEKKAFLKKISETLGRMGRDTVRLASSAAFYTRIFIANRILIPLKKLLLWLIAKYNNRKKKDKETVAAGYSPGLEATASRQEKIEWFKRLSGKRPTDIAQTKEPPFRSEANFKDKVLPSFSRIKNIFNRLDNKKKVYAFSTVVLLIIIPYFFVKMSGKMKQKKPEVPMEQPKIVIPLENDKNVTRVENIETAISGENFLKPINVNGKIFAVTRDNIVSAEDNKTYDLADEFKNPDLAFEMDDLNLILIVKDKKILSWSASARKFAPNSINIPDDSLVPSGDAFLTYAYFLDTKNNQIYRYPRAEGGFGEKSNWLKDSADLSGARDMAINENVYVTDGKAILKFLKGKKQDFTVEESATPILIDKLYTKPESENLYILDKVNSRIIKLGSDGNIIAQFYNPAIANTSDFSVNEDNQTIYISNEQNIQSFSENN